MIKRFRVYFMYREIGTDYTNDYSADIIVVSSSLVKHFGCREQIVRRIVKAQ